MTRTFTLQFQHRLNEDGTTDSICCECFVTVANALSKSDLEGEERKHRCDPWRLDRYKKCLYREKFS